MLLVKKLKLNKRNNSTKNRKNQLRQRVYFKDLEAVSNLCSCSEFIGNSHRKVYYFFGGSKGDNAKFFNNLYKYYPFDHTLYQLNPRNSVLPRDACSLVIRRRCLYIFGGDRKGEETCNEIIKYDMDRNEYSLLKPTFLLDHNILKLNGHGVVYFESIDKMVCFGGYNTYLNCNENNLFSYDFKKNVWRCIVPKGKKPSKRGFGVTHKYLDNKIVITCGYCYDDGKYLNDTFMYNYDNNTWKELICYGDVPSSRSSCGSIIINESIYIYGGHVGYKRDVSDLFVLNLKSCRWNRMDLKDNYPLKISSHILGYYFSQHKLNLFIAGGEIVFDNVHRWQSRHFKTNCFDKDEFLYKNMELGCYENQIMKIDRINFTDIKIVITQFI